MTWIVRTQINWGWGERDLRIARKTFDGGLDVVQPFTFKSYRSGDYIEEITMAANASGPTTNEFLQAIVDHAAEIGIFPTNKAAPTKELDALRGHLEDMRTLVFKTPHKD